MRQEELGPFLEAAERLLRDKVLPAAEGEARFAGLMVASALGMARRELLLQDRLTAATSHVSASADEIRAGHFDGDAGLYEQLLCLAALRTAVTRPQALRPEENAAVGPA